MDFEKKPTLFTRFKSFITQCKRVFRVTKKPSKEEYRVIVKISGLGIAIIGVIGFLIYLFWILIKP
ncbi:MAG: protein translocase SEC61 complex subunit gamma [Nanoarchaeota archaeon]|nr:protein translocase SEC61 complex subunit gamma [Nanoarchaeota archaeon]